MSCPQPTPWLQDVASIATTLGVLGLGVAYFAWRQSRSSFHQAVIVSCTTRFQKLSAKLQSPEPLDKVLHKYLDLCNEELFYFEQKYLPQGIIDEWLEGMVSFIGVWHQPTAGQPAQPAYPPLADKEAVQRAARFFEKAKSYPRIRYAFTLSSSAQLRVEQAAHHQLHDLKRAQAVLEVLSNLRSYQQQPFYAYLHRRRRERLGIA